LVRPQGCESRIFQRGAGSASNDGFSQRFVRFNDADTTLQAFAHVKGHEYAAALREDSFAREPGWKLAVRDGFDNGRPG
jgi:hypothetical protein